MCARSEKEIHFPARDRIVIRGARVHNLKNIDVEIPRNKMVVITGISGSGKSSLAFDTIYAEGQRRYVESLSAYARQFLGVADKPDVDYIEGLSPAISIDQKAGSRNPRSTVGTVTEIYDYLRLLFARIGKPHCPKCGRPVQQQTVSNMVDQTLAYPERTKIQILAPIVSGKKGEHQRIFTDLQKKGFVRVRVNGEIRELDEEIELDRYKKHDIDVVIDRLIVRPGLENRLADSLETALEFGEGVAVVAPLEGEDIIFSQNFACPECGISLAEITPRLFSFNSPYGACSECSGLGYRMEVDPELVVDPERTVRRGALLPWTHSTQHYYPQVVKSLMDHYGCSWDTPFKDLPSEVQDVLLYGTEERIRFHYEDTYGQTRSWYGSFEGVVNHLMRRHRETESEGVREDLERFMANRPCPDCNGARLRPESLAVTVGERNIAEITSCTISEARTFLENLSLTPREQQIAHQVVKELSARLGFLVNVGLDYLTLDRAAGTWQEVRLSNSFGYSDRLRAGRGCSISLTNPPSGCIPGITPG